MPMLLPDQQINCTSFTRIAEIRHNKVPQDYGMMPLKRWKQEHVGLKNLCV